MKKTYIIPSTEVVLVRSSHEMMLFGPASMPNDNFKDDAPRRRTKVF